MTYRPLKKDYDAQTRNKNLGHKILNISTATVLGLACFAMMRTCGPDRHEYSIDNIAAWGYDVEVTDRGECRTLRVGSLITNSRPERGFASAVIADRCAGEDEYTFRFVDDADYALVQFATQENFSNLEKELSIPPIGKQ